MPETEDSAKFAGQVDGYDRLWVPHRMTYVAGPNRPKDQGEHDCPFCAAPGQDDEVALVVARGERVFALLNLYPYNSGHVLICPYRHVPDLTDLTTDEANELMAFSQQAVKALQATRQPQGFNLGLNLGAVAGAGLAAHLHLHVVPRWRGDANFMPIVAQVRALPELLGTTREALAREWGA
ncbi:MAG: HIT domain-containing protein [Micrococcales bacterium]|nr:HIT domain-containing protein [Micrococcales bacterium]